MLIFLLSIIAVALLLLSEAGRSLLLILLIISGVIVLLCTVGFLAFWAFLGLHYLVTEHTNIVLVMSMPFLLRFINSKLIRFPIYVNIMKYLIHKFPKHLAFFWIFLLITLIVIVLIPSLTL